MMMKGLNNILVFALLLGLVSCSDIFETDISKRTVDLISPSDSIKSKVYSTPFWWNTVDGALKYRLQIASPNFEHISTFVLDTTISKSKFTYSLSPGTYQWRVMALNGSSQTDYTTRTLFIIPTSLDSQTVQLNNPDLGSSKSSPLNFSWQSLSGATSYILVIDSMNGTNLLNKTGIKTTSYSYTPTKDGSYTWKVTATDGTKSSLDPIPLGTFIIDNTAPGSVGNLVGPTTLAAKTNTTLTWNQATDGLSGVANYKFYAYTKTATDSTFVTNYNGVLVPATSTPSQLFSYPTSGATIYWRVKAIDAAGNEGPISNASKISITQ